MGKWFEKHVPKKSIQMSNKHMEMCLTFCTSLDAQSVVGQHSLGSCTVLSRFIAWALPIERLKHLLGVLNGLLPCWTQHWVEPLLQTSKHFQALHSSKHQSCRASPRRFQNLVMLPLSMHSPSCESASYFLQLNSLYIFQLFSLSPLQYLNKPILCSKYTL